MIYGDPEAKPGRVLYAGKFRGMNYFVLNKGGEHPCGKCGTCIDRKKAFEANGLTDPVQ